MTHAPNVEVRATADAVGERAVPIIASEARAAAAAGGRFVMAVGGGHSPWRMLCALASAEVPWAAVHLVQVDQRVAPPGDPDRNLKLLRESLLERAPLRSDQIHAMPVEGADLQTATAQYAKSLQRIAGSPPVLDLVHLGLGADDHTTSLIPGDPVFNATDVDVAVTGMYQGRRRMTLTYPIINRSRHIFWLVTGSKKASVLARLLDGDLSIPAGRIRPESAILIADEAAAANIAAGQKKGK